jgi:hypothetical protein
MISISKASTSGTKETLRDSSGLSTIFGRPSPKIPATPVPTPAWTDSYSLAPQSEYTPKARVAALRALEIDQNLPEAHTACGSDCPELRLGLANREEGIPASH